MEEKQQQQEACTMAAHRSKIGGQALIEGVMMKGAFKGAMACRLPDGTIDVETWDLKGGGKIPWYRKVPFARGIYGFISSMTDGYRCLMKSAEKQMTDEDEDEEEEEEESESSDSEEERAHRLAELQEQVENLKQLVEAYRKGLLKEKY